jgi:hyperosmotically inducible protein
MFSSHFIRVALIVGVTMFTATACASTRTQKSFGEQVDDTMITTRVKAELIADPLTKAHEIDVEVFKGRVQLNGFVRSQAMRDQAVYLARRVNGVVAVDNNLKLKQEGERTAGESIDDSTLTMNVKSALASDSRTNAFRINVETRDSVVLLAGFVNSATARSAAGEVARGINGVARVDNQLAVK